MFSSDDYQQLFKDLEQYFADQQITPAQRPETLLEQIDFSLAEEGSSEEEMQQLVQQYLQHSVKTSHPRYFNQLWGGFHQYGFVGDVVSSAANTSMYTHEVAPVATLIEKTLIRKMGQLAGFEHPGGQFTTGGSNGNLMAMLMARHRAQSHAKEQGLSERKPLVAFCSAESHYSFAKAASIIGIGSDQLWKVPVDNAGKMEAEALRSLIQQAHDEGKQPFFVAATAGTTVRGAFDPLLDIAQIAQERGLWFHVDAAWGGAVLLSKRYRQLMKGVELADSLVWDAHKMMGLSLICSALITREQGVMAETFSTTGTEYLFHDELEEDLGPQTMHCGRRNDVLKLWLCWKKYGDQGWEERITHFMHLAEAAEQLISHTEHLELVCPREFANVCFRYVPIGSEIDLDAFTVELRERLLRSGHSMVNYAELDGKKVIRLVLCNQSTELQHVQEFFEEVIRVGREMEREGRDE